LKGKSSRVSFNVSSAKELVSKPRIHSYEDLGKQINLYSKTKSKSGKHLDKDLNDIHAKALQNREDKQASRGIQMEHLEQGIRQGINSPEQKTTLKNRFKEQDKKDIHKKITEAKRLYSHHGLAQNYNSKSRDKDMNKDSR